jgi:TonB family protein
VLALVLQDPNAIFHSSSSMASYLPFPRWGIPSPRRLEVRTRNKWRKLLFAGVMLATFAGSLLNAQQMSVEEGKRKAKVKSNPPYPDLARRMNIWGKVKIEVVIAPDGHVKSSRAVGGHPVLVQPCIEALKDWRFDPAPEETTQLIEFNFKEQ